MLLVAVVVVIIILIIANLALKLINIKYPVCEEPEEYFQSARSISNSEVEGLASVDVNSLSSFAKINKTPVVVNRSNLEKINNKNEVSDIIDGMFPVANISTDDAILSKYVNAKSQVYLDALDDMRGVNIESTNFKASNIKYRMPSSFAYSMEKEGYANM